MKKFALSSVLVLTSMSLGSLTTLLAQDSITIKDPAEYNAYQMAITQSDSKAKSAALESFLKTYPQSVVKQTVLNDLVDAYSSPMDPDNELSASTRLLQIDPNNLKATLYSVVVKNMQAKQKNDQQAADDAKALAEKGLTLPKPAAMSADEWKTLTNAAYPIFHSAMANDAVMKKDFKGAADEFKQELMLYSADATKTGPGLVDTLNEAEAYVNINPKKPDPKDLQEAVWFYARAWDFAPPAYKPQIEKKLDYWYGKLHGGNDGLDDLKAKAQAGEFPPGDFTVALAKTPAEKIHDLLANTPDLKTLALADKETILAYGSKDDADKVWEVLKDQQTPVPGVVIEATDSQIKVAVSDDAKQAKTPDFIVNMKEPLKAAEVPQPGFEYKLQPATEMDGTYDSYTQTPATDTTAASATITLREGFVQLEKKKAPVRKPAAAHHPAAHR